VIGCSMLSPHPQATEIAIDSYDATFGHDCGSDPLNNHPDSVHSVLPSLKTTLRYSNETQLQSLPPGSEFVRMTFR
jgi:hypothetical protein